MQLSTRIYVRIREREGQTMTEYALVMAAIAVVVYAAYVNLSTAITGEVNAVTKAL